MKPNPTRLTTAITAGTLLAGTAAWAGPASYMHLPTIEYGETAIELRLGTEDDDASGRKSAAKVGIEVAPTRWWSTELVAEYEHKEGSGTKLEALEWENTLLLTEPGQYPVDVALFVEVEDAADNSEGWKLKLGPLLQTEFGRVQVNFNPLLERKYDTGQSQDTEFVYEAQLKYRYRPEFEYGLQAFGRLGKWNDWEESDNQTHKLGPAIFGKLLLASHRAVKYDLALLFGLNDKSPDNTLRATIEYEF